MQEGLSSIEGLIIDVVASFPDGIGVNQLSRKLKGKISRVKLIKEIRKLSKLGLLHISRDLRHKQRLLIRVSERVLHIFKEFSLDPLSLEGKEVHDLSKRIASLISSYLELAGRLKNPYLICYIKYRLVSEFSELIDRIGIPKGDSIEILS